MLAVERMVRQHGLGHAERLQHALAEQLADRHLEAALERKLQQHVAGVRVFVRLAGRVAGPRRPFVQGADELGQGVAVVRPWRVIGRQ
jgi:hypothetical protein